MLFCSIKISTSQVSTDLFVWLERQTSNELSKCEIGFRPAPYYQKWCPIITPSKKNDSGGNYGTCLVIPHHDFHKKRHQC